MMSDTNQEEVLWEAACRKWRAGIGPAPGAPPQGEPVKSLRLILQPYLAQFTTTRPEVVDQMMVSILQWATDHGVNTSALP